MTVGIYCYKDTFNDDSIVYIGKDTQIHRNKRHKEHINPSNYNAQQINRVLQNNQDRYKYEVLKSWESEEYSDNLDCALEILYIRRYSPKFNYTIGGDGIKGFKHSPESKKKMSESTFKHYPRIIKGGFQNGKRVYCLVYNGERIKRSHDLNKLKSYLFDLENGVSVSEIKNEVKIIKRGFKYGKQVYAISDGGKIVKQSFDLDKLELELDKIKNK